MKGKICIVVMLALWTAAGLVAQGDRGVITGTVKDASGAVVPGAQVTANHRATNTNFQASTTATGDFTVAALPVGTYQVRIENTGFKTFIANDVVVAAGATARLDATLELGATQQTVEVVSNAAVVTSDTARVSTEVSSRLVNELPIIVNGAVRSPFDLATITPEVSGSGDSSLRIAGGRVGAYGVTLDGTAATVGRSDAQVSWSVTNAPSVEALTEFAVESGGFKAESGHASGGTISFVSKSGTNDFHGNFYEFLRNQKLDARGFFAAQKTIYKQNDFGATVGGPVYIPKLYNGRNKTFFFFSYEGFRNRVGATVTPYTVPPPEFLTGDMRNWVNSAGQMIQVYDPTTTTLVGSSYQRTPFPNNQIPVSKFDPVSKAIIAYVQPLLPKPTATPGTYAYVRNNAISYGTTRLPNNKYSIKGDQVLTSKQRVAFLFGRTRQLDLGCGNSTCTLPIPLSGNPGYQRSDIYRISYDYTISPTWLNRFYAGGNNWRQNHGSYTTYKDAPQSDGIPTQSTGWKEKGICVPNFPDCNMAFPIIAFQNTTTTWGVGAPNGSDNIVVEFRDDMTKVYGKHTFKWGYYYNNTHYNGFGLTYIAGQHNFSYLNTAAPLDTSQRTGSDFASFLLGQVSGYRLDTNRYVAGMYRTHQMYFQDDWRLTPRLTVNLGLRYEMNLAPIYGEDMISNFDPSVPNPGADGRLGALVFGGQGPGRTGTRTLAPNWYGGVGPRVGFSYSLNSKTTLRGAATRSYGPVINPLGSTHYSGFVQQITNTTDTSQGLIPMYTLSGGAPYWAPVPMIDPSVANGTNIPWYNGATATRSSGELTYAFNVQRQVAQNTVAEIGYLSTLASNIQSTQLAYNQLDYRKLVGTNLDPFTAAGRTLLTSRIDSAAAVAAGMKMPFAAFVKLWGGSATVGQSLRPYPQYSLIDTITGGGDRLGHSTYHSMQLKVSRRYSSDLTLQASYVLSKLLTDADSYSSTPNSMDATNLRLEKSIGAYDQTHIVKLSYIYELPFGKGKRFLGQNRVLSAVAGGWRVAGIHNYVSGTPMSVGTTISFPIYNGANRATVPTYEGWRAPIKGSKFDPFVDSFLQPVSYFGTQPTDRLGNATRYNPKQRGWPGRNENFSLARTVKMGERASLDIRAETFNILNRTAFSGLSGGATLQNSNWGLWRAQGNTQRRMQLSMKLYW